MNKEEFRRSFDYLYDKWISVKDRLPDEETYKVLITNGRNVFVSVNWWQYSTEIDWSYSQCCGCRAEGITHWMPLPELPK